MTSLEQMMLKYPIDKEVEIDRFSTTRSAKMVFVKMMLMLLSLKQDSAIALLQKIILKMKNTLFHYGFLGWKFIKRKLRCADAIYPNKILLIDEYDRICEPYERILN